MKKSDEIFTVKYVFKLGFLNYQNFRNPVNTTLSSGLEGLFFFIFYSYQFLKPATHYDYYIC